MNNVWLYLYGQDFKLIDTLSILSGSKNNLFITLLCISHQKQDRCYETTHMYVCMYLNVGFKMHQVSIKLYQSLFRVSFTTRTNLGLKKIVDNSDIFIDG